MDNEKIEKGININEQYQLDVLEQKNNPVLTELFLRYSTWKNLWDSIYFYLKNPSYLFQNI